MWKLLSDPVLKARHLYMGASELALAERLFLGVLPRTAVHQGGGGQGGRVHRGNIGSGLWFRISGSMRVA